MIRIRMDDLLEDLSRKSLRKAERKPLKQFALALQKARGWKPSELPKPSQSKRQAIMSKYSLARKPIPLALEKPQVRDELAAISKRGEHRRALYSKDSRHRRRAEAQRQAVAKLRKTGKKGKELRLRRTKANLDRGITTPPPGRL